jgi:NAD(P)-dependent dehydrogenase (short-subunit alcohol dehydrogenase family)
MIKGRVAIVTGGNCGIGLEVCRQLAMQDLAVVLGSRKDAEGRNAAHDLERAAGISIRSVQLDVTDQTSVDRVSAMLEEKFGRLDILVNNAGVHYDTWEKASNADLEVTVQEALATNLIGPWRMIRALLPLMRRGKWGRIVNVSSEAGSLAAMGAGPPAYQISKAALNALTRTLAAELKDSGILVNSVCPGWVATEMGGAGGRPVTEGAASVAWAALLPDDGPTGGFFRDGRPLNW